MPDYGKSSALLIPEAMTITGSDGNPPTHPDLEEPVSNTQSQKPMQHRNPEQTSHEHVHAYSRLVTSVTAWLHEEKAKRRNRASSPPSEKSFVDLALEKLEEILAEHHHVGRSHKVFEALHFPRRRRSSRRLRHPQLLAHPSDSENPEIEPVVPSVDVVLDNTKTCGYTDVKGEEAWHSFKLEIVRLAITLRLKGWRRVPLERGGEIGIERLSGALTNAVYVVTPPTNLPQTPAADDPGSLVPKRPPIKLLLRIYGPQAEHLINRDKELEILQRLAREHIGPELLGTFLNGRFEKYLNANPLTPQCLHEPDTYKQIAKRMRELHDGIDLLPGERDAGPFVWQNWDNWVNRCEEVITWLDQQIAGYRGSITSKSENWKARGLVCGVPWASFRKAVDEYRKWLNENSGGKAAVREQLVFAHNDTQYGNILRVQASGESPLLKPANEHRQLVVIDFEYANANTKGLEFANHFTEWCYNYHAASTPWACNVAAYPRPEDQHRFIKAYVEHRTAHTTATETLATSGTSAEPHSLVASLAAFTLDARAPHNSSYKEEEKAREEHAKTEIKQLMQNTRLWRAANSAQWVAWGIVQAKVAGMEEALEEIRFAKSEVNAEPKNSRKDNDRNTEKQRASGNVVDLMQAGEEALEKEVEETPHPPHEHEMDDEEGFDYLAYAQDRAMFFWGDLLELGLVKAENLPEMVLKRAKRIQY